MVHRSCERKDRICNCAHLQRSKEKPSQLQGKKNRRKIIWGNPSEFVGLPLTSRNSFVLWKVWRRNLAHRLQNILLLIPRWKKKWLLFFYRQTPPTPTLYLAVWNASVEEGLKPHLGGFAALDHPRFSRSTRKFRRWARPLRGKPNCPKPLDLFIKI